MKEEGRVWSSLYENLKADDSTFLEKIMSLEYKGVQEHFVSTLLGEASSLERSSGKQTSQRR